MNDLTRGFIALIRKIQSEIHMALAELRSIGQSSDPDYEEYSPDSNSDKPETNGEVLAAIKALRVDQGSAEAKKYALDHRRYRLEWKGFRVAKWGAIVLLIYTTLTAIIAIYSIKSADAAKKSADTAAKELELSERPWISIADISVIAPLVSIVTEPIRL